MSIVRSYKPTSPGIRSRKTLIHTEVTRDTPEKSLTFGLRKQAGRNNTGKIMVRHHGGGTRQLYRVIDFTRDMDDVPGKVTEIEYDPNRSALIALVQYANGKKTYILLPEGLKVGETVMSGDNVEIRPGNNTKLAKMPLGTTIHNIELFPGKSAHVARAPELRLSFWQKKRAGLRFVCHRARSASSLWIVELRLARLVILIITRKCLAKRAAPVIAVLVQVCVVLS